MIESLNNYIQKENISSINQPGNETEESYEQLMLKVLKLKMQDKISVQMTPLIANRNLTEK